MLPVEKPYLIAETAFHHQGDIEFLLKLIDNAALIGADAIKFHLLFDLEDYMIATHQAYKALEELMIPIPRWTEVINYAIKKQLDIICLCNDVKSIKWVSDNFNDIKAIELHAVGINDTFLLREAAQFDGTIILGSGGSSLDEIQYAVDILKGLNKDDVFLMHGFQNYPTDYKDIVFSKMSALHSLFNLPIGYADHTDPEDEYNTFISVIPQSLGFNVLEKHFTHAYGEKRIDSQAAVSIAKLKEVKSLMDIVWSTRGDDPLAMSIAEKKYGDTGPMKKAIVARKFIEKGKQIKLDDVAFKRTNHSAMIKQKDLPLIINSSAREDIQQDETLDFSNVEYNFNLAEFSQFFNK